MRLGAVVAAVVWMACGKSAPAKIDAYCTMTSWGEGDCNFTNTGAGAGTLCGNVWTHQIHGRGIVISDVLCSGKLRKGRGDTPPPATL